MSSSSAASTDASSPTFAQVRAVLPRVLASLPQEWRGTTFNNSNLLGRDRYCERLGRLFADKAAAGDAAAAVSEAELVALGNAEDYLRVATNVATTLEFVLAREQGRDVSRCFTFASRAFPAVAVLMAVRERGVHLYHGDAPPPFTDAQLRWLATLSGHALQLHTGTPSAAADNADDVVLVARAALGDVAPRAAPAFVDGVVEPYVLHIANAAKIVPADVLVIRKRMATPLTTPAAEAWLQRIAGVDVSADSARASADGVAAFYAHLQTMSGAAVDTTANPVVTIAGLPAICTLWTTLVERGGADLLLASTCYGGSSQLTDILTTRGGHLNKHTFDIQGDASIVDAIKVKLDALAARKDELLPLTVVFVEIPTNPDMKVLSVDDATALLAQYRKATGKDVLLLVDATFAPASGVLDQIKRVAPEQPAMVFISLSKSVSRGLTTGGTLVANHTPFATELVRQCTATAEMLDTTSRDDQLAVLAANHTNVEKRCDAAYAVACKVGAALQAAVKAQRGESMPLAFVSEESGKRGFTSSTFSFNLPPLVDGADADNAALAQRYVDQLTVHAAFKPCVSFGQDNGLAYATVPATSTQGAISEEHKAKQARGGVQLVRLSFPPTCDVDALCKIVADAVEQVYKKK